MGGYFAVSFFLFRSIHNLHQLKKKRTLVFSHKGKHLQHDVAQKSAHQVFATPSIQQRHIQHHDVSALCLGEQPPLL